jgi:hypothetical protein
MLRGLSPGLFEAAACGLPPFLHSNYTAGIFGALK